jgi:hypothetical protein
MKEFVQSFTSLTLGLSVFSLQLLGDMLTPVGPGAHQAPATRALDSVTHATAAIRFHPSRHISRSR